VITELHERKPAAGGLILLDMKTLMRPSVVIVLLLGVIEPAQAGPRRADKHMYPRATTYESNGSRLLVRKVQRALAEDGYYVGSTGGEFGYETRSAIRRYRRDHGLPIVGKIDEAFLRTLGFQERDI
jgi:peptidoglycan hydrolase-like protein with peptidoglycan-binding domain